MRLHFAEVFGAYTSCRDMVKVFFVIFQTENRANGGVESITQVINRLERVQPVVVTQRDTPVNERWRAAGATVHVLPAAYPMRRRGVRARITQMLSQLRFNWAVYRWVVSTSGRVVVHCNDMAALWHAGWGARAAGAALVFNIRSVFAKQKQYHWKWRAVHLCDRILCLSREMKETLQRRLPGALFSKANTPVDYIHSIVDFEQMHPVDEQRKVELRDTLEIGRDEFALLYVATINERKGQLRLIEQAGELLKRTLPEAKVYFVGDFHPEQDRYAGRCQEAVRRRELQDTFVFAGYTDAVEDWYQVADAGLVVSRREGMARCMIEALACGTPVVSFDVCSAREILEQHDCGRVVHQENYRQLVQHLEDMAASPQEHARLGTNGARAARQLFEASHIIEQYEEFYHNLA